MTTNTNAALRSAAESALEALEALNGIDTETESVTIHVSDEIAALRAALTAAAAPAAVAGPSEILEKINSLISSINEAHRSQNSGWRQGCFDAADNTYKQIKDMLYAAPTTQAAPQPAVQQGDELPREDFAWLVVQEACETEPADEDDPECIRILRRDLKSAVLSAFLRHDAAHPAAPVAQVDALDAAFEAVRQRLCELQRYSFVLDDDGVVRRVQDARTGNWIEFDDAHALFDPVAVDAARAKAKEGEIHE